MQKTPESDEVLMLAAAWGDHEAFGELVNRHYRSACKLACRFLCDEAEAQDVAQEAIMKIYKNAFSYQATAHFRTYLRCVVTRLCLDTTHKKHPLYMDTADLAWSCDPDPFVYTDAHERECIIRRSLGALPESQRMAIILRYYCDLSYREIALNMDVSVKAVEGYIRRGRRTLNRKLKALNICLPDRSR